MFKRNSLSRTLNPSSQKREMSVEPVDRQGQEPQLKLVTHTVASSRFNILTKGGEDIAKPTLLWEGLLVDPVGIKKKHLVFKSIEYVISNWSSDQFPSVIYVLCEGVSGYLDKMLAVTTRVAALQLQSVAATMDQSQVRTYELRYINRDPQTWEVPITLSKVTLSVSVDDNTTAISLPLPNPILLNFQVRRE